MRSERIKSRRQIEELFGGKGSHSRAAFPIKAVYMIRERPKGLPAIQTMVSVPKRHFKHAVDRNRVKRQLRETFRQNRQLLAGSIPDGRAVAIAFLWLAPQHMTTGCIGQRMKSLLVHIAGNMVESPQQNGAVDSSLQNKAQES